jgi:hypothetical protein
MTRDEIMCQSAEKAIHEMSWESLEYLFRPSTMLELLLRIDYDGMKDKIIDWCVDNSPSAMPHRFRGPYISQLDGAIKREEFYRKMKTVREIEKSDDCFYRKMKELEET